MNIENLILNRNNLYDKLPEAVMELSRDIVNVIVRYGDEDDEHTSSLTLEVTAKKPDSEWEQLGSYENRDPSGIFKPIAEQLRNIGDVKSVFLSDPTVINWDSMLVDVQLWIYEDDMPNVANKTDWLIREIDTIEGLRVGSHVFYYEGMNNCMRHYKMGLDVKRVNDDRA